MKFIFFPISLLLFLVLANPKGIELWCLSHLETSTFISFLAPYIMGIVFCGLLIFSLFFITMKSMYRSIYITFIPLIVLPLLWIKHPYSSTAFEAHTSVNEISNFDEFSAFTDQRIGNANSAELYGFFSIDCGHCLESAITINAMYTSGHFPSTVFIFRATQEQMDAFVILHQIKVPHFNIESQMDFDQLAGNEFPRLTLKKGNNLAHLWQGNEVNNWVFDFIKSSKK